MQLQFKEMIQRIQTIYLFGLAFIFAILPFLPLYTYQLPATTTPVDVRLQAVWTGFVDSINPEKALLGALLLLVAILGLAIYTLVSFKKRKFQILMCKVLMLLVLIFTSIILYFPEKYLGANSGLKTVYFHYNWPAYLPLIALVMVFLAQRAIKKDEDLVRSADRLR